MPNLNGIIVMAVRHNELPLIKKALENKTISANDIEYLFSIPDEDNPSDVILKLKELNTRMRNEENEGDGISNNLMKDISKWLEKIPEWILPAFKLLSDKRIISPYWKEFFDDPTMATLLMGCYLDDEQQELVNNVLVLEKFPLLKKSFSDVEFLKEGFSPVASLKKNETVVLRSFEELDKAYLK